MTRLEKALARLKQGARLPTRECCICDYMMHIYFSRNEICIDTACSCVRYECHAVISEGLLERYCADDENAKRWDLL